MTISTYEIAGIAGKALIMLGLVHSDFLKVIDLVLETSFGYESMLLSTHIKGGKQDYYRKENGGDRTMS